MRRPSQNCAGCRASGRVSRRTARCRSLTRCHSASSTGRRSSSGCSIQALRRRERRRGAADSRRGDGWRRSGRGRYRCRRQSSPLRRSSPCSGGPDPRSRPRAGSRSRSWHRNSRSLGKLHQRLNGRGTLERSRRRKSRGSWNKGNSWAKPPLRPRQTPNWGHQSRAARQRDQARRTDIYDHCLRVQAFRGSPAGVRRRERSSQGPPSGWGQRRYRFTTYNCRAPFRSPT